jgi:hypothetical protein
LDAAIAFFASSKPIMDYDISSYATGSRPWWCTTFQDHATIQELLLEDIHSQQEKNRQLGTKIEQIVQQHKILRQQASSIYDTPSERLKQSPIINIVTKTVATDMFLRHHNNPKGKNKAKRQQKSYKQKEWSRTREKKCELTISEKRPINDQEQKKRSVS